MPCLGPITSTLPYSNPPPTTFYHFSPHLKLIAFLVKQNRAFLKIFFGKVFPRSPANSTATCCIRAPCDSPQLAAFFLRRYKPTSRRPCLRLYDIARPKTLLVIWAKRGTVFHRAVFARWNSLRLLQARQPSSPSVHPMLCLIRTTKSKESPPMEWTTPQHEEIDLNCEISSYANAEI
jgi:hypothetical protein